MSSNMNKFFPECQNILWTNGTGAAVAAGDLVRAGGRWGRATVSIANGATGVVMLSGEVRLVKGAGYTLAEGQSFGWDGGKAVDAGTVETPPAGRVVFACLSGDTVCIGRLEPVVPRAIKHTVTAGEDTANQVDIVLGTGRAPSQIVSVQIESTGNVRRSAAGAVTALSGGSLGTVRIVDAGFAAGEVVHLVTVN